MQRGKVIHYNSAEGQGRVSLDGAQYEFAIQHWGGSDAPALNRVVEVALADGQVVRLMPVSDGALMQETAGELGKVASAQGAALKEKALATLGLPILACQGGFLLSSLVLPFASAHSELGLGWSGTLHKVLSMWDQLSGSSYLLLFYLACIAPALPLFLRARHAWLALALPLLLILASGWGMWSQYHHAMEQAREMAAGFGGQALADKAMSQFSFGSLIQLDIGSYLSLGCALALAGLGLARWRSLA